MPVPRWKRLRNGANGSSALVGPLEPSIGSLLPVDQDGRRRVRQLGFERPPRLGPAGTVTVLLEHYPSYTGA